MEENWEVNGASERKGIEKGKWHGFGRELEGKRECIWKRIEIGKGQVYGRE